MAPFTSIPLSPAELSYLHTSLSAQPPIRPDGRAPPQFRPLVAETDILPATNGSASVCFADGTEAVVGVKAEVEKRDGDGEEGGSLEVSVEIPGLRDDDSMPVFLAAMVREAVGEEVLGRLGINGRFGWRLYVDVLLLSQPLSYPLPLLSLTSHLALLSTRLPALISEKDEDPLFNDDWEASTPLYPPNTKPPITLLTISVGGNIFFDPSREELAVADAVVAISAAHSSDHEGLEVVALRTIDPPSRLTAAGIPDGKVEDVLRAREEDASMKVWRPPRGGVRREVLGRMIKMVVEKGGVGEEVMEGLRGVEV